MFFTLGKFMFLFLLILPSSLVLIGNGKAVYLAWLLFFCNVGKSVWILELSNPLASSDVLGIWNDRTNVELVTTWKLQFERLFRRRECFIFDLAATLKSCFFLSVLWWTEVVVFSLGEWFPLFCLRTRS